ncbi:MAG TPA: DUF6159 family protein [Mycobacterium sp.]|nr:DUF6159 family protein [Mycobacterium sp.]
MKADRSLVVFPILSAIFAILAATAIFTPAVIWEALQGQTLDDVTNNDSNHVALYIAGAATAYVSTFIAIFFNVALAGCAVRSLRGDDTKVGEGINAAMRRIGPIIGWSLLATTVGLVLKALENRASTLGRIAVWLAGAAWAIATFFVIPVLALEGSGPVRSLKRSAAVVKARWGESATGAATITAATSLVAVAIAVVGGVFGGLLTDAGQPVLGGVVFALAVAGVLVVSIISAALSQIFRVAVYEYAVTGQTTGRFDPQLLQTAFVQR